ncbi:GlsB/YeaQ/YmgE family stress response membrane protein [Bdellovibrio sp. HCB288]|uniref:GlsB/YeaQ/YmgE family stress response membrane protein n=1 Tax=Bdellovibrio sp. HCB288 TaxID=3394355 RepID=UPI0039B603B5
MDFGAILTTLLSGLAGGNIAGSLLKKLNLGPAGNSIAGIVGGFLGGPAITGMVNPMTQGGAIFSNIAGSGIGGAVVMILAGLVKNWWDKRQAQTRSTSFRKDEDISQSYTKTPPPPKSRDYHEGPRP